MLGLGLNINLNSRQTESAIPGGTHTALVVPSASIPELEVYITAEEQTGLDGSAISTITDQSGNIFGITPDNILLKIAAGGDKEFDFVTANANINLGNPASMDFTPITDEFTVLIVAGSVLGGTGTTFINKGDKVEGANTELAIFYSGLTDGYCFLWTNGPVSGFNKQSNIAPGDLIALTAQDSTTSTQFDLYYNGILANNSPKFITATGKRVSSDWTLGVEVNGAGFANSDYEGSMKAFMVFSKALTPMEILNITADFRDLGSGEYTGNDAISLPADETNTLSGSWASIGVEDTDYTFSIITTNVNSGLYAAETALLTSTLSGPYFTAGTLNIGETYEVRIDVRSENAAGNGPGDANLQITHDGTTIDISVATEEWTTYTYLVSPNSGTSEIEVYLYPSSSQTIGNKAYWNNLRINQIS